MTTPSGQISLNDVNVELGLAGTTLISMNQSNVRTLAGVGGSGTQISMQNLQGKSNIVNISYTFSSNTADAALNLSSLPGYSAGKTNFTITVNSGVYVYATSTGGYGLSLSGATTGDTVTLVNNGYIMGMGGSGNNPGGSGNALTNGNAGGPALNIASIGTTSMTITNTSGYIGGGGGSGCGARAAGLAGAGGGGAGGGVGGSATFPCSGTASGGTGGNPGSNGGAGGQAVYNNPYYYVAGGGGGGRVMPGTTTSGRTMSSGSNTGGGSGGSGGGAGGIGAANAKGLYEGVGGGGGGYGASGGTAKYWYNASELNATSGSGGAGGVAGGNASIPAGGVSGGTGGSGGKGVNLGGKSVTWTGGSSSTSRVYGAIS